MSRECQINRKVAESYFGILEDMLIGVMIPAFQKRARRRIIHHPKFFLFDAGVFRAIRPRGPLDSAIEVKRKRSVVSNDLNGLKAFASEYPEARRLLFYGGEHEAVVEGVRLVPFGMAFTRMEELVFG